MGPIRIISMIFLQDMIQKLTEYWAKQGCAIHFGYDLEMGAGTFNPTTFFRSLGPEPYSAAYLEPSRRPTDGRYGDNPSRMQHFLQFQVILKPSPQNIQQLYLKSLAAIDIQANQHDVRFVHDDWKSPTLGAWGLGWEVWIDGMEVSQFTYFQSFGGQPLDVIPGEITYGIERLAMYKQNVDNVYQLKWNQDLTYGEIYHQNEVQWSRYNYEVANTDLWSHTFESSEKEAYALLEQKLPIPAYDFVMKASHAFNMLEARGVISVSERTNYINRVRKLSCKVAAQYLEHRKVLEHPLLKTNTVPPKANKSNPPSLEKFIPEKTGDFVLEIGVEELPQSFIPIGIKNLKKDLESFLKKNQLSFSKISTFGSPRRLTAYVEELACGTLEQTIEKKGPSTEKAFDQQGNLTAIGKGFLDSLGKKHLLESEIMSQADPDLTIRDTPQGSYLFVCSTIPSQSTADIFIDKLPKLILDLDFPQKMIWSDLKVPFPRPLQWLVALHDKQVVPLEIAGITASNHSWGHPLLFQQKVEIKNATDYFESLEKSYVLVDPKKREQSILQQLEVIEKQMGAKATHVQKVLKEVLYLTEYPQLMPASFDPSFLQVPKQLLELVLITHQKHFPLQGADSQSEPHFIACLDTKPNDLIKRGHEKAVSPRLADGLFLYQQDLKHGLDFFADKLTSITFHQGLGNLSEKSKRVLKHAQVLNQLYPLAPNDKTFLQIARYLKADLASSVVFDFPELQGTMGQIYADHEKHPPPLGQAIYEHWLPRFEEDKLPTSPLGVIYSLADKIDNLLACFLSNRLPTSSSDPFALRRQALGIARILIEHRIDIPLSKVFEKCQEHFNFPKNTDAVAALNAFFESRLKTVLSQYDLTSDEIQAAYSQDELNIYDRYLKTVAIHTFKNNPHFVLLLEVYKRAKGQLSDKALQPVDPKLFTTTQESALFETFQKVNHPLQDLFSSRSYLKCFDLLLTFHKPLADLFENVKVLVDDPTIRNNRLALLQEIILLFHKLLDFDALKKI